MSNLSKAIMEELSTVIEDGGEIQTPHCCQSYVRMAWQAAVEIAYLEDQIEELHRAHTQ